MIHSIKQELGKVISRLYPQADMRHEFVSQGLIKGGFFIDVIEQDYSQSLHRANKTRALIDLSYFPKGSKQSLRRECEEVKQNILRNTAVVGNFRPVNRSATIIDDVLHIQMTFRYKEKKLEIESKMEVLNQNAQIKEAK